MAKNLVDRKVSVGGLVFSPSPQTKKQINERRLKVHVGIKRWIDAGQPENSLVYDFAGALVDYGIPIVDAVHTLGVYHKTTTLGELGTCVPPAYLRIPTENARPHTHKDKHTTTRHAIVMVDPEVTKATTGKGKMSRGVGSRVKPKVTST